MENLKSAFLGALIALTLSSTFSRYSNARRLNRIRKLLISYLNELARNKLEKYISDSNKAIKTLELRGQPDKENHGYDEMPMLTSEVFKSFPQSDLFTVSLKSKTYTSLLDFYYAIEFLKNNMPLKAHNEFSEWTNKHLEDKKIPAGAEQFKHIATCQEIDRERKRSISDIKMKISTANGLKDGVDEILTSINGSDFKWIAKYLWSQ